MVSKKTALNIEKYGKREFEMGNNVIFNETLILYRRDC